MGRFIRTLQAFMLNEVGETALLSLALHLGFRTIPMRGAIGITESMSYSNIAFITLSAALCAGILCHVYALHFSVAVITTRSHRAANYWSSRLFITIVLTISALLATAIIKGHYFAPFEYPLAAEYPLILNAGAEGIRSIYSS